MKLLLIDTCGEVGSVALSEGNAVAASEMLATRSSSSALLPAIARLLRGTGWTLAELDGVGVVNGPGSFTGVRVGLAAAKGLCCAAGVLMAAVSRLEVLADVAGLERGCAVLDAGRGEFYVQLVEGESVREMLCGSEALREAASKQRVVIAETKLLAALAEFSPEIYAPNAADALIPALRILRDGGSDVALADANYVRGERDIYRKASGAAA